MQNFWNWFLDNHHTIKNLLNHSPQSQETICYWIKQNLNYYCRKLDFIIVFPKRSTDQFEFIITANGNSKLFKQVIDLVDNAPQLRNWKFTTFIQPTERIDNVINGLDEPFIFQEITLKATEFQLLSLDDDPKAAKIDTIIFLKNYNWFCNTKTLKQAIFIILQNIPGENVLFQNIHLVQLAQRPEPITDIIHLHEFQEYLDNFNLTKNQAPKI